MAKLCIGDISVGAMNWVVGPEIEKTKFGIGIDDILGDVNSSGVLVNNTDPASLLFDKVKDVADYVLVGRFAGNDGIISVDFLNLEQISGKNSCTQTFKYCNNLKTINFPVLRDISGHQACESMLSYCNSLQSISFPILETITGPYAFRYLLEFSKGLVTADFPSLLEVNSSTGYGLYDMFYGCSALQSVNFNKLHTVVGISAMYRMFYSCTNLNSIDFTNLTKISGNTICTNMFYNCKSLTSISFPSLITIEGTNPFGTSNSYIFNLCTNLLEIHFRNDMQGFIESLAGYNDKFGATNATIYFDL